LHGRFITGCDSGVSQQDIKWAANRTKYITGLPDPSTVGDDLIDLTTLGVLRAIEVSVKRIMGQNDLKKTCMLEYKVLVWIENNFFIKHKNGIV
jgi:hypothetical protein